MFSPEAFYPLRIQFSQSSSRVISTGPVITSFCLECQIIFNDTNFSFANIYFICDIFFCYI